MFGNGIQFQAQWHSTFQDVLFSNFPINYRTKLKNAVHNRGTGSNLVGQSLLWFWVKNFNILIYFNILFTFLIVLLRLSQEYFIYATTKTVSRGFRRFSGAEYSYDFD